MLGGGGFDAPGDELGVVLDEAEQRRAARVLPGEPEEVQAGDVGDAAPVAEHAVPVGDGRGRSRSGRAGSRSPRRRRRRRAALPSAKRTVRPEAPTARGFRATPNVRRSSRGLEPMSVSRPRAARGDPTRESTLLSSSPSRVSHQNRSRPSSRCGSGVWREPTAGARCASPTAPWRSGSRCCRRRPRATVPAGTRLGRAIGGAVRLEQLGVQLVGERRHARRLERPGRDDDLVRLDAPAVRELEHEAAASLALSDRTWLRNRTGRSNVCAYRSR